MPDDEYERLQHHLVAYPEAGDLITGSGGLRKIRWKEKHRGKRGGIRIIYYWWHPNTIFMLYPYRKSETADLTRDQIRVLKNVVKEWLNER